MSNRRRAHLRAGVLVLVAANLLACTGGEVAGPRNILLISLDTVRADRIGCYGRVGAGTPTLDALAARGLRFADAMAPAPMTLPSHATLFSGQAPFRHGVRHNGMFALSPRTITLAERFAEAGFRTAGFVGSMVLDRRYGLAQGFEAYVSPGRDRATQRIFVPERPAAEVRRDAVDWLDTIGDDRFFLFVHFMEPHAPYEPPEPERTRFAADRYQGEIAAADRELGELLAALERRGKLKDTLVFVVADHGESLDDHDELTHGIFLYQATLHVPMIAAGPGVRRAASVDVPVGLVDVPPTLLEATGLPLHEPLDGHSLWPALTGEAFDPDRGLYAETFVPRFDFGWSELRALRRGSSKYVEAPRAELYSLDRDPGEMDNLAPLEPERAANLARELGALVAGVGPTTGSEPVQISDAEREALQALGYLAGDVPVDLPANLADPKDGMHERLMLDRVDILVRDDDLGGAEQQLLELVRDRPTFFEAQTRLLLTLILQGNLEAAIERGRELVDAAGRVPDGERIAATAHRLLGAAYLDHERLEDAVMEYELSLKAPQSSEVYDLLAALYFDLGRRREAIALLQSLELRGEASPRSLEMLRRLEQDGSGPLPD